MSKSKKVIFPLKKEKEKEEKEVTSYPRRHYNWSPLVQIPQSTEPQYWEEKFEYVTACSEAKKPKIIMKWNALAKIVILMTKFPKTEWAADLLGKKEDGKYIIEDIYIFEQEVDDASVIRKSDFNEKAIGVIHSHHNMGNFFSHTDDEFPNENHDLSGVVAFSKTGGLIPVEIEFTVRVQVPCGKFFRIDGVKPHIELPNFKLDLNKIKKVKREYQHVPIAQKAAKSVKNTKDSYGGSRWW